MSHLSLPETRPITVPTIEDRIEHARSRVPVLSESQRATLAAFDATAKNSLEAGSVMDVVGVLAGIKPVALVYDGLKDYSMLKDVGLHAVLINKEIDEYAISRDPVLAEELQGVLETQPDDAEGYTAKQEKVGRLLGYPATGTEYFVHRIETMDTENLPMIRIKEARDTVDAKFQQLILSPEHYREEVQQYSEPLQAAVRELAPHSYELFEKAARRERIARKINRFLRYLPGVKNADDSYPVHYV